MTKNYFLRNLMLCLFSFAGISAFAYDCEVDGIYYDLNTTDHTASVAPISLGYSNYSGVVNIPNEIVYDGTTYSVTSIGDYAFSFCTDLTDVTIPNSVTSIGNMAFQFCTGLTKVAIPNSVTFIDKYAFINCRGLTELTIPSSVTSIGWQSFSGCSSLTGKLIIPNSVISIDGMAFSNCGNLTELIIGNSVTSIGRTAFGGCNGLTSVTSLSATPPTITNWNAFDEIVEQTVTLHVPTGCKEAYQQAEYWKNFLNIQDDAVDGIESIYTDKQGKNQIYTLNGKRLNMTNATDLPKGIYIIDGKKVTVK